jgi:hypothetical protein
MHMICDDGPASVKAKSQKVKKPTAESREQEEIICIVHSTTL